MRTDMNFGYLRLGLIAACFLGLTACSSTTEQALQPQTVASNTANIPESANAEPANPGDQSSAIGFASDATTQDNNAATQVASLDLGKSFTFLPVEGAPQSASTALSRSLKTSSQSKGLTILPANQSGAKYRVKGYFSAFNDGSGTLLVYVWDVLDQSGKRVHRINGRERSSQSASNPWRAVSDAQYDRMANSTTANLKAWVEKQG